MSLHNLILRFLLRFAVIYGLLIVPWPGWNALYGQGFRAVGEAVFGRNDGQCVLYFEPHRQTQGLAAVDSRIVLGNPQQADSSGKGPAQLLSIDTRSIGWVPVATTAALILATPISWRRRALALLWGLLSIHAFILFSIWAYIWNESTNISLVTLTPFWKEVADGLQYTLVTQMGVSFSVPVLIWIVVVFRRHDVTGVRNPA
jgi:hypothetical protein